MNSFGNLKPTSKTRPNITGLMIFAHTIFCYGLLSEPKPVVDSLINSEARATSRIFMGDTLAT
jgi:hypothetical protein